MHRYTVQPRRRQSEKRKKVKKKTKYFGDNSRRENSQGRTRCWQLISLNDCAAAGGPPPKIITLDARQPSTLNPKKVRPANPKNPKP